MAQAYARVRDFLAQDAANGRVSRTYTSQRLADIAGDIPRLMLAQVIVRLLREGQLEQFVRVKTSSGRGLVDFASLSEVPSKVYDFAESFEDIPVLPENIEVTYRLPRSAD